MSDGGMSRARVLNDHVKIKHQLVPPLIHAFPMQFTRWVDSLLPELLWMACLNHEYGWARGTALARRLALAASAAADAESFTWWAPASAYIKLTPAMWESVRQLLGVDVEGVATAIEPLICAFPTCPMAPLLEGRARINEPAAVARVKPIVGSLYDRTGIPATQVQANAVYLAFETGMLSVFPESSLLDLPEVERYPTTELSLRVAANVRASVTGFYGHHQSSLSPTWPREFWQRGRGLGGCE